MRKLTKRKTKRFIGICLKWKQLVGNKCQQWIIQLLQIQSLNEEEKKTKSFVNTVCKPIQMF